ncbi:MAG: hypothetical protein K8R45_03115 [Desulfobacterales bacterium]|nr:hypothetical protein [Desulfobacterales bacterium]
MSLFSKIWNRINNKYKNNVSEAKLKIGNIDTLHETDHRIKKTKLLIIFSLYIQSITSINEFFIFYNIFRAENLGIFFQNTETTINLLFNVLMPIIGFLAGSYLLLRRQLAIWILSIWSALYIIPIFISYNEQAFHAAKNPLNYINVSPMFQFLFVWSSQLERFIGNDYIYNMSYIVEYNPFVSGIGINFVPILYLGITGILIYQNRNNFRVISKKSINFIISILLSTSIPYIFYFTITSNEDRNHDILETKVFAQQSRNYSRRDDIPNTLAGKCSKFATQYFENDKHNLIKRIICEDDTGIIEMTYSDIKK